MVGDEVVGDEVVGYDVGSSVGEIVGSAVIC